MSRTIVDAFEEILADQQLTPNQKIAIGSHVDGVSTFLRSKYSMAELPFAMGSAARGTICRSERDIDVMAPFSVVSYWKRFENDSRDFLYWLRNALNEHYGRTEVSSKQIAVVVDFKDTVADVVPAFPRKGGGFLIPNGRGGWRSTEPRVHANVVQSADAAQTGRLIPLVKLMKTWNFANGGLLRSFHVELMVERIWRNHTIGAWSWAVRETIRVMPGWLRNPFIDPWEPGGQIDQYLADGDRTKVLDMLAEDTTSAVLAEDLRNAGRHEEAFDRWKRVYRGAFPSYR